MKTISIFGMVCFTKSLRVKLLTCSLSWLLLFSFISPKTPVDNCTLGGVLSQMIEGSLSPIFIHFFNPKDFLKNTFPFKTKAPVAPADLPDESEKETERENEWNEFTILCDFNLEWIQSVKQSFGSNLYSNSNRTKISVPLFVLYHSWKSFLI